MPEAKNKYPLNSIYFYLTDGCNLCCRHCWIQPKYQSNNSSYLALNLFKSIIEQAKPLGLSGVKLSGGEPLLHPQIKGILQFIQTEGLRLVIETNGLLCAPELAQEIEKCKDPFASVSLDGADAKTHEWMRGVKGSFAAAMEGARNLIKAGVKTQIIMTLMRRNKEQVERVVHLAESLRAESIKFNILQPTARGEKMHAEKETLTIGELIRLGRWVEDELAKKTTLRLCYSHPLSFSPLGRLFDDRNNPKSCGMLGIIGVLANGTYALCGIGETVPELVFGDVTKDKLEDVWSNNKVLQELRQGLPSRLEGICRDCLMKEWCLGYCVAQNYYHTKSFWCAFWYCQEAYNQGLFPKTRLAPKNLETVNV